MSVPRPQPPPFAALALGTLGVAVADMALAMTYFGLKGVAPLRILQGIAAALLGRETALAGGLASAALGAAIHLVLAALMVTGYWYAARRAPWLASRPLIGGLGWGLFTWAAMKFVLVPLTLIGGRSSSDPLWQGLHLASHLFIVGLPSAMLARALVQPLDGRSSSSSSKSSS